MHLVPGQARNEKAAAVSIAWQESRPNLQNWECKKTVDQHFNAMVLMGPQIAPICAFCKQQGSLGKWVQMLRQWKWKYLKVPTNVLWIGANPARKKSTNYRNSMLGFIHNNRVTNLTMDNDLLYPISSYFVAKSFQVHTVHLYLIEVSASNKNARSFK